MKRSVDEVSQARDTNPHQSQNTPKPPKPQAPKDLYIGGSNCSIKKAAAGHLKRARKGRSVQEKKRFNKCPAGKSECMSSRSCLNKLVRAMG